MLEVVYWLAFAIGLMLVWLTVASIVSTLVVPRYVPSRITYAAWSTSRALFRGGMRFFSTFEEKDRLLAFQGPVSLLLLLTFWLALLLVGYALMFLPFDGGSLGAGLRISGSSMTTLGFYEPVGAPPPTIVFLSAATGLIVIALLIGYLPMIYGAYSRREVLVTMLESRAGEPAWGPEILARESFIGGLDTLGHLYSDWESWAADVAETHTTHPWLMAFRSPHPLRSWITSLLAVMDSGALYLACAPSGAPSEARNCVRMGFVALRAIAEMRNLEFDPDPRPDVQLQLSYEDFLTGIERMRRANFPMERTPEDAWTHFHGWRVNYEQIAYALADDLTVVPALWSGPRTLIDETPISPIRPMQRSPERPEGIEQVDNAASTKWAYRKLATRRPATFQPPSGSTDGYGNKVESGGIRRRG
jgi:hypothetical protein